MQFIDVSVDRFPPSVREWVKVKTGKTSVPQIFFNAKYIGGNKELQSILDDPELRETALEHLTVLPGNDVPLLPSPGEALVEASEEEFVYEKDKLSVLVEKILAMNVLGWNWRVSSKVTGYFDLFCFTSGELLPHQTFHFSL